MTEKRKAGRPSRNTSRRTEILQKAAECFVENGYNHTTLDQIGKSLGFNKAALYYYFRDKEDLFSSVLKAGMLKVWEDMKSETNLETGAENKLLRYFNTKTDGWLVLLNINGVKKENIINLNMHFAETILFYRNEEIEFLKGILKQEFKEYSDKQTEEFICLLIDTQTDITMNGILMDEMNTNPLKLKEIKAIKDEFLLRMLESYRIGFLPD